MTPHQLAGQTAKMLGLSLELAKNRTGESQRYWLNGFAQASRLYGVDCKKAHAIRMDQPGTPAASRLPACHLR